MIVLVSALVLSSSTTLFAHAYVIIKDPYGNRCLLSHPTNIQVNKDASLSPADSVALDIAIEAWNDAPVNIHFTNLQYSSGFISPDVVVSTVYNQLSGSIAQTTDPTSSCPNGYWSLPISIRFDDTHANNEISAGGFSDNDYRVGVMGHELGHVLGLAESNVVCSLGYSPTQFSGTNSSGGCGTGIWFPVIDDLRGVASVYGWTRDSAFAYQSAAGNQQTNQYYSRYTPPMELIVVTPNSGTFDKLYNGTSLPSTGISEMFAFVTPKTLYRFHMGWSTGCCSPSTGFANLELDSDGGKLVYFNGVNQVILNTGFTPLPNTSYFIELVVVNEPIGYPRAFAYFYAGSMQYDPGTQGIIAYKGAILGNQLGATCVGSWCQVRQASWSSPDTQDIQVWTDSSSNPASDYGVDHFWNFNGNKPLVGQPDYGVTAFGNNVCLSPGASGQSTLIVSSINAFFGTVGISLPSISSGITASVSPNSVSIASGGTGYSWVSIQASSTAGVYSITVQVTNAPFQLSRSVLITVDTAGSTPSCQSGGGGSGGGGGGYCRQVCTV